MLFRSIILPNGSLSNGNIDNFSQNAQHRISWRLNLEYGTDFSLAKEKILEIIKRESRVINIPDSEVPVPSVSLTAMKDSTIELTASAWVNVEDYWKVMHDLNEQFYTMLPQSGFTFGYPKLDLNIRRN